MPALRDEIFLPESVDASLDRDDPSVGEVSFLINQDRLRFQLTRSQLQHLADALHLALRENR